MRVGVLALQGAFARHLQAVAAVGAEPVEVRTPAELATVAALVLPGGESTTLSKLLDANALFDPLAARLREGLPAFGTCAGMILLARQVLDGRADQRSFDAIDVDVRRNAFGRQVDSFETELDVRSFERPVHAVFIRAPRVERVGDDVEVLASVHDHPVLCRSGAVLIAAFHPELTDDLRLHRYFLEQVAVPRAENR